MGFSVGHYVVWIKRIENGNVYLKAFEVTKNDPLSVDRLKERSLIELNNPTDSIVKFGMKVNSDFTIYEGDWDKPYSARFDLCFILYNGGKEIKLIEKIFKIEVWKR